MPVRPDQVRPGLKVRIIVNNVHATTPGNIGRRLESGDVVTLNGPCDGDSAEYDVSREIRNWVWLPECELAEPDPMSDRLSWPDYVAAILSDPEDRERLANWFRYLASGDTSWQKILVIVGPPRSGKSQLARVIEQLVGPDKTEYPLPGFLVESFGLSNLIGKSVVIIGDLRERPTVAFRARMLSIVGEDVQAIDRQHRPIINAKLPVRFVMLANQVPEFGESISRRLSVLMLANPDPSLSVPDPSDPELIAEVRQWAGIPE